MSIVYRFFFIGNAKTCLLCLDSFLLIFFKELLGNWWIQCFKPNQQYEFHQLTNARHLIFINQQTLSFPRPHRCIHTGRKKRCVLLLASQQTQEFSEPKLAIRAAGITINTENSPVWIPLKGNNFPSGLTIYVYEWAKRTKFLLAVTYS